MTEATYKFAPTRAASPAPTSHASLIFSHGDLLHAVSLREGQSLVVGRAEPAQVVLDDRSLSRTHARFTLRDGRVLLQDLDSTNGTAINGHATKEAWASESDLVCLGSVEVRLSGLARQRERSPQWLSQEAWIARLDAELVRARTFGRTCAVAAIRLAEDSEANIPLRPVDLACHYAPRLLVALIPEAKLHELSGWLELVRRTTSKNVAVGAAIGPEHGASAEVLLARAIESSRRAKFGAALEVAEVRQERPDLAAPVIASPAMLRLYELIARIARTSLPVLVLGETGSGKELVAQAVHQKSPRAKGPFKALNCATIPANLIESVLFGHEKGAFTGADKQAPGIFEQAHGGTVFLDEVGELSERAQAALLRVLETKRVVRVGATKEIEVDVRVVAATHRDLGSMVKAGTFRDDLMYRLDALSVRVPPLRERREEISELARVFLQRARVEWGASAEGFSEDALEALEAFEWPGNVRQLKNVVERAVAVCTGNLVDVEDLPEQVLAGSGEGLPEAARTEGALEQRAEGFRSLPERVREFEMGLIRDALDRAHGNQAQAARILGVPRRTLAHKVQVSGNGTRG